MEIIKPQCIPLRKLGKTGLEVPAVGFGGLVLRDLNEKDAFQLIEYAVSRGIRFFDTARHYRNSETLIGHAQKQLGPDRFIFSSKTMARSYTSALSDLEESLKALQISRLDIYGFHHVQTLEEYRQITGSQGALKAFKEAKEKGLLSYIMLSSHSKDVLIQAASDENIDVLMFPYNFPDAEIFNAVLQLVNTYGKGSIAIKLLAGGNIRNIKNGIQFVMTQPFSFALTGARTIVELDQFLNFAIPACDMPTSAINTTALLAAKKQLKDPDIPACIHCSYCHDQCPKKIPISMIFELLKMTKLYRTGHRAKDEYALLGKNFCDCIQCRNCLSICPENIDIPFFLEKAHHVLTQPVTEKEKLYHGETGES